MNDYWKEVLAHRQIKDPSERISANMALRKMREEKTREVAHALALDLVRPESSDRAWQRWFWFNHFNVLPRKSHIGAVLSSYLSEAIEGALDLNFVDLLQKVTVHPAMLMYLDNVNNTKAKGNENLARELLELHTLGVSGGYSQQDVLDTARILTGWTVQLSGNPNEMGRTVFRPAQHDPASRNVFGKSVPAGGESQLGVLLKHLATHPATAQHIARKLCLWWFDVPPEAAVQELAAVFTRTGGSLPALWQSARDVYQRMGGQAVFKDPMHYLVSSVQVLCGPTPVVNAQPLLRWMRMLGQPLLGRSTPDGYPLQGSFWLSAGQLAQRIELAHELVAHAHRLTMPATAMAMAQVQTHATGRFELQDLRTVPAARPWLAKQPDLMTKASAAVASGNSSQSVSLWPLYLASPEFMYRNGI